jgi:hypothetical protein
LGHGTLLCSQIFPLNHSLSDFVEAIRDGRLEPSPELEVHLCAGVGGGT